MQPILVLMSVLPMCLLVPFLTPWCGGGISELWRHAQHLHPDWGREPGSSAYEGGCCNRSATGAHPNMYSQTLLIRRDKIMSVTN